MIKKNLICHMIKAAEIAKKKSTLYLVLNCYKEFCPLQNSILQSQACAIFLNISTIALYIIK